MNRIEQFQAIIAGRQTRPLQGHDVADAHILAMIVHAAFADGTVNESEFDLIHLLMPDRELGEALVWIGEEADQPLDLDAVLAAFPQVTDRLALVRLAATIVSGDGVVSSEESEFVETLRKAAGL